MQGCYISNVNGKYSLQEELSFVNCLLLFFLRFLLFPLLTFQLVAEPSPGEITEDNQDKKTERHPKRLGDDQ